ncbi:MAG: ABC transporter permease [Acidimicrobiales bacterium]
MRTRLGIGAGGAMVLLPIMFIGLFFLFPVGTVVGRGLGGEGLDAVGELMRSSRQRSVLWFTFWQAVVSTVLTLAVALPAAATVGGLSDRARRVVRSLVTVPFVLPTVVVAGAFDELFFATGLDSGAFRLRHTVWAILIAHIFFNYAVVVRVVGTAWAGLDGRQAEAARVLGASRWWAWREVTLPLLRPAISSASAIVFLFSFTSFGAVLILGGPRRATLETEIYRYAVSRTDLTGAAALAVVQLAAVLALVAVSTWLERRRPAPIRMARSTPTLRSRSGRWINAVVASALLGVPLAVLVERSFSTGTGYGLGHYEALGTRVRQLPAPATTALWNSVHYAVLATALAVLIGVVASVVVVHGRSGWRRLFDLGLTLPLGTSAVTIGFGMLVALDEPPVDFRTRWWIIPVAHALVGVPFVVRTMVPLLRSIDPSIREAAAVLGASRRRIRREIDLVIGARGALVGGGFAFAVSLGEFGATSFLPRRPDDVTAPVALFRLLSTPGDLLRGQAMALAVVLMVLVSVSVFVIESSHGTTEGSL